MQIERIVCHQPFTWRLGDGTFHKLSPAVIFGLPPRLRVWASGSAMMGQDRNSTSTGRLRVRLLMRPNPLKGSSWRPRSNRNPNRSDPGQPPLPRIVFQWCSRWLPVDRRRRDVGIGAGLSADGKAFLLGVVRATVREWHLIQPWSEPARRHASRSSSSISAFPRVMGWAVTISSASPWCPGASSANRLLLEAVKRGALVDHSEKSLIVLHMRLSTPQTFCSWATRATAVALSPRADFSIRQQPSRVTACRLAQGPKAPAQQRQ